jgi:outer membrane protein OmpA-like peptidoglycan-associated protein
MKSFRIIIIAFVLIFITNSNSFSQKYSTKSAKAIKKFTEALDFYQHYQYSEAISSAKSALKSDSMFVEAYFLLSDVYGQIGDLTSEIKVLRKAVKLNPEFSKFAYINLSRVELETGQYVDAKTHISEFEKRNDIKDYSEEIKKVKIQADFGIYAESHPVEFHPKNLGPNINTKYDEYHPVVTADEQTLIFTVGLPRPGIDSVIYQTDTQEDFFISRKDTAGFWQKAIAFGAPLNTPRNEGAHTLTADGRIMYFTACEDATGYNPHGTCYGRCDIYKTEVKNNNWSKPENIGLPINTKYKETQPSISPDGRILLFASDRPGGKGGLDIWQSTLSDKGMWSKPVNLGDSINTSGDEVSPFLCADRKTLYFSSNGWTGLGKSDIFFSRKNAKGQWTKAQNLGYPVNTYADQTGLTINTKGNRAYFAADYKGGYGRQDIYEFEIPENLRPKPSVFVKGLVYDAKTNEKLYADFDLINLETKDTVYRSNSDAATGQFILILPLGENYALNINKKGYLFYSANFSLPKTADSIQIKYLDIPLSPIESGGTVVLKNIFFEFDKYDLKPESEIELEKLAEFLKTNPTVKIEIGGHTDNTGTKERNKILSTNRAKAVFDDLISRGIDKNRLTYKGYAETVPVATNDTPEGRAENRRTEFKIF